MEELESAIIKNIVNLCQNKNIINYAIRVLKDFKDDIIEINEKHIYAKYYDEVLEINIKDNYFTIYSTNWGTTNRRKIFFLKIGDNEILHMEDNEINCNGVILKNYTYQFNNNELSSAKFLKRINTEFEHNHTIRKNNKEESIDIIPIKENIALKKVIENGNIDCYLTTINKVNLDDIELFTFMNSNIDSKIDYNEYQAKVKKIKVVK